MISMPKPATNNHRRAFWRALLRSAPGRRCACLVSVTLFTVVFWQVYAHDIAPIFGSQHYTYHPPAPEPFAFSLLLIGACTLTLPLSITRPSQVLYWILFLTSLVPITTIPYFVADRIAVDPWTIFRFNLAVAVSFLALGVIIRRSPPKLRVVPLPSHLFWVGVIGLSGVSYLMMIITYGVPTRLAPLTNVYVVRSQFVDLSAASGALIGYMVHWQAEVVNPMLIAIGLSRRRAWIVAVGIAGEVFIYADTGFKSVLLTALFMAVVGVLVSARRRTWFAYYLCMGSAAVIAGSVLIDHLVHGITFEALLPRRIFYDPGLLGALYDAFFSSHPLDHLSHSFLHLWVHTSYDVAPAYQIGRVYYPGTGQDANAGIWPDAFANFGLLGVFVFTLLLGWVMLIYDGIMRNRDLVFGSLVFVVPSMAVVSTGLFTSLLSHGVGLAIALMWLLPRGIGTERHPPPTRQEGPPTPIHQRSKVATARPSG